MEVATIISSGTRLSQLGDRARAHLPSIQPWHTHHVASIAHFHPLL